MTNADTAATGEFPPTVPTLPIEEVAGSLCALVFEPDGKVRNPVNGQYVGRAAVNAAYEAGEDARKAHNEAKLGYKRVGSSSISYTLDAHAAPFAPEEGETSRSLSFFTGSAGKAEAASQEPVMTKLCDRSGFSAFKRRTKGRHTPSARAASS